KMRVNRGQDFVIGGYTVGGNPFDAIVFGYYDGDQLIYVARTRNGFTRGSRAALFKRFKELAITGCPFANLPEGKSGWGQGLTKEEMARLPLGQAGASCGVRVRRVDGRQSLTTLAVRAIAGKEATRDDGKAELKVAVGVADHKYGYAVLRRAPG